METNVSGPLPKIGHFPKTLNAPCQTINLIWLDSVPPELSEVCVGLGRWPVSEVWFVNLDLLVFKASTILDVRGVPRAIQIMKNTISIAAIGLKLFFANFAPSRTCKIAIEIPAPSMPARDVVKTKAMNITAEEMAKNIFAFGDL